MEKIIMCESCGRLIEYRDELVTVQKLGFGVRPLHKACYAEEAKGVSGLFLGQPNNGTAGVVSGVLYLLAAVVCLFIGQLGIFRWIIIAYCLYGAALPLISRNMFEKHLKE